MSASVLLLGCATAMPVVYREGQPGAAAEQRLANDIADCRRQAERAFGANANDGRTVARQAAKYGLAEFAQEAAEALVEGSRRVWEKARAGAAGGAASAVTKLLFDWNEPDAVYKKHVERCLARRGHEVLGWR
ncbi:hypothetical protein FBR04_20145 [Betaproteobacteria bacterium PRO7]|nr:hypothetical protein [Betaproteobacteria bacterium PRO7]